LRRRAHSFTPRADLPRCGEDRCGDEASDERADRDGKRQRAGRRPSNRGKRLGAVKFAPANSGNGCEVADLRQSSTARRDAVTIALLTGNGAFGCIDRDAFV
jgi:hypothetical protein